MGQLDKFGQMTGSDVAFLYPDLKTALVGEFRNGELVSAFHAIVTDIHEELGLIIPSFEKLSKSEFRSVDNYNFFMSQYLNFSFSQTMAIIQARHNLPSSSP